MSKTIGFIGLGNMGSAILNGLHSTSSGYAFAAYDICESVLTAQKDKLTPCSSVQQCCDISDIVILAVKPHIVPEILSTLQSSTDTLYVSIAAGVSIDSLETILGSSCRIIRVMPNTPALIGSGMSVLAPNGAATNADLAETEALFTAVGSTLVLPEKLINAVTGVSGCGPAYIYTVIQAMADGGVKMGLSRSDAVELAAHTVLGSARMVLESGHDPITLRNMVTSPGGSTIAGVHRLESHGISGAFMDAVEEATRVTEKLGKLKTEKADDSFR